jgi:hypothetical protein
LNNAYFGFNEIVKAVITVRAVGFAQPLGTVYLNDGGNGYTDGTGFTIDLDGWGDGTGGSLTYDVIDGSITNLQVQSAGSGYSLFIDIVLPFTPEPDEPYDFKIIAQARKENGDFTFVHILSQRSNTSFEVVNIYNPDDTFIVELADDEFMPGDIFSMPTGPQGGPAAGYSYRYCRKGTMVIYCIPSDGSGGTGSPELVRHISNRRVKTFEGNTYSWGEIYINNPEKAQLLWPH